jgi:hypothetical protein
MLEADKQFRRIIGYEALPSSPSRSSISAPSQVGCVQIEEAATFLAA